MVFVYVCVCVYIYNVKRGKIYIYIYIYILAKYTLKMFMLAPSIPTPSNQGETKCAQPIPVPLITHPILPRP